MSQACCAIDVHTHVVPARLPDERPEFAGLPWPSIKHTDACHAQVVISGKNYRDINDACWSVPRRTEQMPGMDVGMQVLSPMPELLSYWLPTNAASVLARHINETIAEMVLNTLEKPGPAAMRRRVLADYSWDTIFHAKILPLVQ